MCSRGELLCAECATAEVIPAEKIIAGRNVIEYIRLRRQGFVAAWSGNGQICMVKREAA
jgi:hypothetical protein